MKKINYTKAAVTTLLILSPTIALAESGTLTAMVESITDTFSAILKLIPVVAVVGGMVMFLGSIWAFKEASKQQSSPNWLKGAVFGLVGGTLLMYFGATTTMFGKSLMGETNQAEVQSFS